MQKLIHHLFSLTLLIAATHANGQFQVVFEVPNNNSVYALETKGSLLFAGTGGNGIYRSSDNGNSWTDVNNGIPGWYYYSLLSSGDDLYAGSFGMVHRSVDNGASWEDMNIDLDLNDAILALERSGPFLYAGVEGKGVFSLLLGSGNWTNVNNGLHQDPTVNDLMAIGNDVFAATNSGVYKSTDNAASWVLKDEGLSSDLEVNALFHSNADLFAGTSEGVFKSADQGETWVSANTGLAPNPNVRSFAELNDTLYVGTYSDLYYSVDSGENWSTVNTGPVDVTWALCMTTSSNAVFVGSSGEIYRSAENALNVRGSDTGFFDEIKIFPNPASDRLTLSIEQSDLREIRIISEKGETVRVFTERSNSVDVSSLSAGTYIIRVVTSDHIFAHKFVKE